MKPLAGNFCLARFLHNRVFRLCSSFGITPSSPTFRVFVLRYFAFDIMLPLIIYVKYLVCRIDICNRYLTVGILHSILYQSIFCGTDICHSMLIRCSAFSILCNSIFCDFNILRFRYFATSLFCFQYFAFYLL